jgi:uncharacterized membrane protein YoaK (UPF0700 family)
VTAPDDLDLRDPLLLALTFIAGWVDAIAYVSLGRVFTGNMTGNLVLLGINAGDDQIVAAIRSIVAVASFALGALLGGVITRGRRSASTWPRQVTLALLAEVVLLLAFTFGWLATGNRADPPVGDVLVALGAAAMGLQSAAARRVAVSGISTTAVTSTLTSLMTELAALSASADRYRWARVLAAIVLGAWFGSLTLTRWPGAAPIVPTALLIGIVAIGLLRFVSGDPATSTAAQ